MKKGILITVGALIVVIVAALILVPWLYKERIAEYVKAEANTQLDATVDFDPDIGVSLIRSFPNLSVRIDDISIANAEPFEEDTLFRADRTRATVNLMSLFRGDEIQMRSLSLNRPDIHVIMLEDGRGNWDIMKPAEEEEEIDTPEETEEFEFQMALQEYSLNDANFIYDDQMFDYYLELNDIDHSGQGDFTQSIFELRTQTSARNVDMSFEGMPLLSGVEADLEADVEMNIEDFVFTFMDNHLELNELGVEVDGFVGMPEDAIDLDLAFNAVDTRVEHLLSLVPAIYTEDFEEVESTGDMAFNGHLRGIMDDEEMPGFALNLDVSDGTFDHPQMPEGFEDLNIDFAVNNDHGDLDSTIADLSNFSFASRGQSFSSRFYLETPMSDPYVEAGADGDIDLAVFKPFVPMDERGEFAGHLSSAFDIQGHYSTIEAERYTDFDAGGSVQLSDFHFYDPGLADEGISIADLAFSINPEVFELSNFDASFGPNEVGASGELRNMLAYAMNGFSAEDQFSDPYIDFNGNTLLEFATLRDFMPLEEDAEIAGTFSAALGAEGNLSDIETEQYDQWDFEGDVDMQQFRYADGQLPEDVHVDELSMSVDPERFNLSALQVRAGDTDMQLTGEVSRFMEYMLYGDMLQGELTMNSTVVDLNPWMEAEQPEAEQEDEEPTEADYELEIIDIPDNLDLAFNGSIGEIAFGDWDIRNFEGGLKAEAGRLVIDNTQLELFEGTFALDGHYEPYEEEADVFFDFDVSEVSIPEAYRSLVVVERFAPIAENATGSFDGEMEYQSYLNRDFSPQFNTINSHGRLSFSNVGLEGSPIMDGLAERVQLDRLKNMEIENFSASYTIHEGRFSLEPTQFSYRNLDFGLSGSNLLDGTIDYDMEMAVPSELLERLGGERLTEVVGQSLDLQQDQNVVLNVNFAGPYDDPDISTSFKDMVPATRDQIIEMGRERTREEIQEHKDRAREEVDQARDRAREEVEERRREIEERAREREERAREEAEEKKEEARDKVDEKKEDAEERIRDEIDDRTPW